MALIGLLFLHKIQPLEIQMQFLKKYFEFKKKSKIKPKNCQYEQKRKYQ